MHGEKSSGVGKIEKAGAAFIEDALPIVNRSHAQCAHRKKASPRNCQPFRGDSRASRLLSRLFFTCFVA
jgi:hypothetical protein